MDIPSSTFQHFRDHLTNIAGCLENGPTPESLFRCSSYEKWGDIPIKSRAVSFQGPKNFQKSKPRREDPKDRHSKQRPSCDFEVASCFLRGRGCSEVMGFDGLMFFFLGWARGEGKLVSKMFGSYMNIMSISCQYHVDSLNIEASKQVEIRLIR